MKKYTLVFNEGGESFLLSPCEMKPAVIRDCTVGLQYVEAAEAERVIGDLTYTLKLAIEYWRHRQQRYKNRKPQWVELAEYFLDGADK